MVLKNYSLIAHDVTVKADPEDHLVNCLGCVTFPPDAAQITLLEKVEIFI